MHRTRPYAVVALAVVALSAAAFGKPGSTVVPRTAVAFQEVMPGVTNAAVEGQMASGPSHFYLRYAAGLATPLHHHSADHYVTTLSGTLVLVVDGKEHRLPPGSFFSLTGKAPHVARCEGSEDCVMLVDARAAWDVVPEPATK